MSEPEKFTPQTKLLFRAEIPVEDAQDGEELYRQLSEMLKSYCEKSNFFGSVIRTLQPCCGQKGAPGNVQQNSKILQ